MAVSGKKEKKRKRKEEDSLRTGCILLVPQRALHLVVQQQGAAPADQRRRCPERSGSSLGSGWPVAVQKKRGKGSVYS